MERIQFELHQGGRAIASTPGYVVGNFCVYKGCRCWHIAHLHTHTKLLADFARRKDALAVVAEMDGDLWNFDTAPGAELLDNLWASWTGAIRHLCVKEFGVLREKPDIVRNQLNKM